MSAAHTPAVSVIMPVHNAAPFLREAITSILGQTFTDFELIIVNDGSTDGSGAIIDSFSDARIRAFHQANQGISAALNAGIEQAHAPLIARMDADDVSLPERLARQVDFLRTHPNVAVVASFVDFLNVDGEVTGVWDTDRAAHDEASIDGLLPRTNCIAHPTVMLRREALGALRYDPRQHGAEDWDLWLRLRSRGHRIAKIPEALVRYRMHPSSIMGGLKRKAPVERRLLRARTRTLLAEWGRGRFSSFQLAIIAAQVRNLVGAAQRWLAGPFIRDLFRLFTYSPLTLWKEARALSRVEAEWTGRTMFLFPYVCIGGAERVHADIAGTITDQDPLIVIFGRSRDRGNEARFTRSGHLLEIPRLLHHPFTRSRAHKRLAALLARQQRPVLFGALSAVFFDLLPLLNTGVRAIYLQHAFLYQPKGNAQWRSWLPLLPRVNEFIFVSNAACAEFDRFLHANNLPRAERTKLHFISNAVSVFGDVRKHDRPGLLFVGRDSVEKRAHLFFELCARLEQSAPERFRFTAVGVPPPAGPHSVQCTGPVEDERRLAELYAEHDVLALTSDREGFPLVIMEAMAAGLAILSTPVGDVPDRVRPAFARVTSSTAQETVLAEMSTTLLAWTNAPEELDAKRKAALAEARAEFHPEVFRARYRTLLLGSSGTA